MHRSSRPSPARHAPRPAPTTIRGSSSGQAPAGIALLLSAADDGRLVVGNTVDHGDMAIEVLLMYSVADSDPADRHWQVEPPAAQCMLLGFPRIEDDSGADNRVVFVEPAAPVAARARVEARVPLVY